ncbi:unnamed protein product, partial [Mesorhabditis spiculigera]
MDWWTWIFFLIGCLATLFVLYKILYIAYSVLWPYYLGPRIDLKDRAGAEWAVITGATDGIGQAYAFALAEQGFKILLISRTQSRLDRTKEIIHERCKTEVRTFAFDFTSNSLEDYEPLLETLESLEIGILVNNVGMAFDYPDKIHKIPGGLEKIHKLVNINVHPPTLLSMAVLPHMVARESGIIINIGSSSANYPLEYWSAYSASKKYVEWLTRIMAKEYKKYGIIIQCITPMKVATKASGAEKSLIAPDPKSYVHHALRSVGLAEVTTGHPFHQLQVLIFDMPAWILDPFIGLMSRNMRKEGLKKAAQE